MDRREETVLDRLRDTGIGIGMLAGEDMAAGMSVPSISGLPKNGDDGLDILAGELGPVLRDD